MIVSIIFNKYKISSSSCLFASGNPNRQHRINFSVTTKSVKHSKYRKWYNDNLKRKSYMTMSGPRFAKIEISTMLLRNQFWILFKKTTYLQKWIRTEGRKKRFIHFYYRKGTMPGSILFCMYNLRVTDIDDRGEFLHEQKILLVIDSVYILLIFFSILELLFWNYFLQIVM